MVFSQLDNNFDRWSVAVRMPRTPSHFPSVFHFEAACFGSWSFTGPFGGVSFGLWGSIERGERNVSLVNIERLAGALNVTMAELMPDQVEQPERVTELG